MITNQHIVIIGVGQTGMATLDNLPEDWTVTAIDLSEQALSRFPDTYAEQTIEKIQGDATSRLILERAGLTNRTKVAITTDSDAVNLEIARLLKAHFPVKDLICVLHRPEGFRDVGLSTDEVVLRTRAAGRVARNRLTGTEPKTIELQLDRGELEVFRVLPGSAAIGRPLRELKPRRWLAAAIYRDEQLLVPHGATVLQAGDRVMLVGEPAVIARVGQFINGAEPTFPTQYGANIGLVSRDDATRREAEWLLEQTQAEDVVEIDPEHVDPNVLSPEDIALALAQRKIGMLAIDDARISLGARLGFRAAPRKLFIAASRVPVLISRSAPPYKRVLVAVGVEHSINAISVVAMDIATLVGASLSVMTVVPPALSADEQTLDELRELPQRVAALAQLHNLEIETITEEGNPIERIRSRAAAFDLLVVGYSRRRYNTVFTPDTSLHLMHRTPCSVLFVPWNPAGQ
ncbi:MAG: NAD-binding protein [Myxococcota bacterium]